MKIEIEESLLIHYLELIEARLDELQEELNDGNYNADSEMEYLGGLKDRVNLVIGETHEL